MTLDELLKDKPDVLKEVKEAVKSSGAKFVDLAEGGYVDKNKYADLESKYTELKNAPNPLEEKIKELEEANKNAIQTERDKLADVVRNLAIDNAISSLGIDNELIKRGIRAELVAGDIKIDENYKAIGLDERLATIKEVFKDSLSKPISVSTGQSLPNSSRTEKARTYTSADVKNMTVEDAMGDIDNIIAQLGDILE